MSIFRRTGGARLPVKFPGRLLFLRYKLHKIGEAGCKPAPAKVAWFAAKTLAFHAQCGTRYHHSIMIVSS